jgi:hypothetical protein
MPIFLSAAPPSRLSVPNHAKLQQNRQPFLSSQAPSHLPPSSPSPTLPSFKPSVYVSWLRSWKTYRQCRQYEQHFFYSRAYVYRNRHQSTLCQAASSSNATVTNTPCSPFQSLPITASRYCQHQSRKHHYTLPPLHHPLNSPTECTKSQERPSGRPIHLPGKSKLLLRLQMYREPNPTSTYPSVVQSPRTPPLPINYPALIPIQPND